MTLLGIHPRPVSSIRLLLMIALAVCAAPVAAATFIVDQTSDEADATPGDDLCAIAAGGCTLRAAIQEANANVFSEDTIRFALPVPSTIAPASDLPTITGRLVIDGPGADALTLDAGGATFALNVNPGGGTERAVTIRGLTATGGGVLGLQFAGSALVARLSDCVVTLNQGAGISVSTEATLTVERCAITDNMSGGNGAGVAIAADTDVTVRDSTVAGNEAMFTGGGFSIGANNTVRLENVTVTGNEAGRGAGIGMLNFPQPSTVTVLASTVVGNTATGVVGGIDAFQGTLSIGNTVIAGNSSPAAADCLAGPTNMVSLGGNLVGEVDAGGSNACPFADGVNGDQAGTPAAPLDPVLGMLGDNGGPTETLLPMAGSPALDRGLGGANCPAFDQRGFPRPLDGGVAGTSCDVGSVEVDATSTVVFADRFESGDTSAWSATVP